MSLTPTVYYDDFKAYFHRAERLELMMLGQIEREPVGDPLQDNVPIYNNVHRRYAGFSKVPEDLWIGRSLKLKCPSVKRVRPGFNIFKPWHWHYLFLVHRITGSGASFEEDHGYRNTIVPEMANACYQAMWGHHPGTKDFYAAATDKILEWKREKKPIFTSLGNQIPPFNKPTGQFEAQDLGGGIEYLIKHAPQVVDRYLMKIGCYRAAYKPGDKMWNQSQKEDKFYRVNQASARNAVRKEGKPPVSVKQAVDAACEVHKEMGMRQFHFVLTAFAMDTAEYFPLLVNPASHCYYGKNAWEAMELLFDRTKYAGSRRVFYDDVMARVWEDHPQCNPMDLEDVMCDYIRYVENYIPKAYRHKNAHELVNWSSILHPKLSPGWIEICKRDHFDSMTRKYL